MKRRDFKVVREGDKYPFTLGAVVESLQGVGVPTDEAIAVARRAEKHLRSRNEKNVPLSDLVADLSSILEESDPDLAARFVQQTPPFVPLMVTLAGERTPFSKRTLAKSLQKLDFSFKDAHAGAGGDEARGRPPPHPRPDHGLRGRGGRHLQAPQREAQGPHAVRGARDRAGRLHQRG